MRRARMKPYAALEGIQVADPYEWLPSYGESGVEVHMAGLEATIMTVFEKEDGEQMGRRGYRFHGVCALFKGGFPGAQMLNVQHSAGGPLSALVEFPRSEAAAAWRETLGKHRPIWHYRIVFLAENIVIEIFAEGFMETEET